jgi:glutamate-1-semialdehyde 2,1-aminomutase
VGGRVKKGFSCSALAGRSNGPRSADWRFASSGAPLHVAVDGRRAFGDAFPMTTPAPPGDRPRDHELLARAQHRIPGGVNSPVRAFRAVGGVPVFVDRAEGAYLFDREGKGYVDFVGSWGPMILGHAHPDVVAAIQRAAARGTSFGAPTVGEIELAEAICELYPSIDMMRAVSSGTEAAMSAARVARGFTKRAGIVKAEGCYHGHADFFLVKAGSGLATLGTPDSAGVPAGAAQDTIVVPFNDLGALEAAFVAAEPKGGIAGVFLEPVVGNMGCVPPRAGYLEGVRDLCAKHGAMFVLDEVMTGSRLARGGAQERFGLKPDLTVLGKIIGGGMPLAAYGGRRDVMHVVAPLGPVYQAGTLSGNPVAVAAALATIPHLTPALYERLEAFGAKLQLGLEQILRERSVPGIVQRVGSMFTLFFTERGEVRDWSDAATCDTKRFGRFHERMLAQGIYLPPSQFEAAFISGAHGDDELARTLAAAREALREP